MTIEIRPLGSRAIERFLGPLRAEGMALDPETGMWLAAARGGDIVGVARVFERGGEMSIDDVWVRPDNRKQGVARAIIDSARTEGRSLWLICDEDKVELYKELGFKKAKLPPELVEYYSALGEWQPADHTHVSMRAG